VFLKNKYKGVLIHGADFHFLTKGDDIDAALLTLLNMSDVD